VFVTSNAAAEMYHPFSMGETAENVANDRKISCEEQGRIRFSSQQQSKYFAVLEAAKWDDETAASWK
jgi:acetyl-CoA C-acetyltransferase